MKSRNIKWLHLALALSLGGSGAAFGADVITGRIDGRLRESGTQAPLPGAKVTLTSPALIGGSKVIATAPDGYFLATDLPPGEYTVQFELEGIKPITRKLVVRQGETSPLNVTWNVESDMEENIVVEYESPGTRPESTQSGAVLSATGQSKLASGRSYQAVAQQVAGVSGGSNPDIRGANAIMNRYLIDGMDITDPVTNTFSSNINFDSISSFSIITGGMEAQYNSMGGVINVISAQGSDEFHADASFYANHYLLSVPPQFGSNLYEGYKPFNTTVRPPTQSYQGNVNISGPILKEKLWYALSYQYSNNQASSPAGPPLNLQAPNREFIGHYVRGKLTWAPGSRSRVTLSALTDPASIPFADFSGSLANSVTPFAARFQSQGGWLGNLTWEYFPTAETTYKAMVGAQTNTIRSGPQGVFGTFDLAAIRNSYNDPTLSYDPNRPQHTNDDDGTVWFNDSDITSDARYTLSTDLSVAHRTTLFGQRHEAQAGFQGRFIQRNFSFEVPGGRTYTDAGGGPGQAGLCLPEIGQTDGCNYYAETPAYNTVERGLGAGLYVQDRWKPVDWVTIMPGLRFDYGYTRDAAGRVAGQLAGFGPRLGAVLDLTRDSKTIFSAFYGRSNETLSLLAAANASPSAKTDYYAYDPATGTFDYSSSEGGPGATEVDRKNHTPPHSDEILLSLRRQIGKNTGLSVEYTYKNLANIWDAVETNQIWDPSGTRVIGYKNGVATPVYLFTRPDSNWIKYQSVDLILDGRPTPELEFYAAYTLSFRYGPGNESMGQLSTGIGQYDNPRQSQFYTGYSLGDTRHQIKLLGSYTWKGLSIGPSFSYASGATRAKRYNTANPNISGYVLRSPVGTTPGTPNDPTQIAEFRLPDTITANARISYDFSELTGQKFALIADVFNVFNLGAPTGLVTTENVGATSNFGLASARQQPLRVQLALRYQY
ncbi:protein oar [Cystobacter fuscus DSM 2262]|uniref:Protein oar n=1 Tax=Cystobacter fuscus (strain ATCC 25194 / DSM 2262 / NBRC 100088 / M29) TaxID=1242864 RepID=S9Q838_CYSF2|nr:TonB-dependent receptor [Cystobacter fuscus]EPX57499.1 protein oar [Cystobacter fuscus DSM 2262]